MKPLLSLLLAITLTGCATHRYMPAPGQDVIYTNGSAMTKSSMGRSLVYITPVSIYKGRARFALTVGNKSHAPFTVYANQVTATNELGKPVKVYTAQQMEQEARTRANVMAVAAALNAGGQSLSASLPDTTYHSGSINTQYSHATYSGVSTTYSPARSAMARQRINDQAAGTMSMISQNLGNDLEEAQVVFDTTTILPKQAHPGMLITKAPKEIHFTVTAGGDVHRLSFIKSK